MALAQCMGVGCQEEGGREKAPRAPNTLNVYPGVASARKGGAEGAISLPLWLRALSVRSPGDTWARPAGSPAPRPRVHSANGHVLGGTHVAGLAGWVRNVFINAVFRANSILF